MEKIKNKYSDNDTDFEHISRSNKIIPPRILRPHILSLYGLNMTAIYWMIKFIEQGLPPRKIGGKALHYTGIRGIGYKTVKVSRILTANEKSQWQNDMTLGKIRWEIDTSTGSGKSKVMFQYRDMEKKWRTMWDLMFFAFLNEYVENIWPKHLHFIMKDTILSPLPFKYFEFFVKSETANRGNLCADFAEGDTLNESIYKAL